MVRIISDSIELLYESECGQVNFFNDGEIIVDESTNVYTSVIVKKEDVYKLHLVLKEFFENE